MRGITSKLFVLALITIAGLIILTSCEHSKGSLKNNQAPTIHITSYNGSTVSLEEYTDTLLYQQTIYWQASDQDGVVDGYAFRITDGNGDPVVTYGYEFLNDEGWVYHFKDGANENDPNHPLGDESVSTIWTGSPSATVRFPASISQQIIRDTVITADSTGIDTTVYVSYINDPATDVPYKFEVKCIDNRGAESNVESKYFFTYSVKPKIGISTNKGELSTIDEDTGETVYKDVGLGIRFVFSMNDDDPYVANGPVFFKYKLYKVDHDGNYVPDDNYPDTTQWFYAYDGGNISRQVLTSDNTYTPPLVDFGTDDYLTRIQAIGLDEAQLESEISYRDFRVKEGFYPGTLVYNYDIFVLGDNHFVDYRETSLEIDIPSRQTLYGTEYSTPMFIDQHGRLVAMHSDDLQIHMYWGYRGEFNGNNPRDPQKTALVLDEQTGINYLSEIRYFDIRLNGNPYYSPLFGQPSDYVHEDEETGDLWTRFYVNNAYAQKVTLVNLAETDPYDPESVHRFEVRAVDLQNVPDPTPAEFTFKLDETLDYNEKEGILVIDDEVDNVFSPNDYVTSSYESFLEDIGTKETLDYDWLTNNVWDERLHFSKDVLSPTDLQKYKLVIWHAENPPKTIKNNFAKEYDVMNLYLRSGGNIIVIGGANLSNVHDAVKSEGYNLLEDYFGIAVSSADDVNGSFRTIPGSVIERPYFLGSKAVNSDWPDVMVNPEGNWEQVAPLISLRGGIGAITYFNNGYFQPGVEVLYKTIVKDPEYDNYSPDEEEYNMFNDRANVLRFRRQVEGQVGVQQTCYLVGFPTIYMQQDQVKEMLLKMVDDIMTQND